jgi:uncharacterized membrane protein (DUF4010 family)
MDLLIFQKVLLSLAIGSLIGLERERHAKDHRQMFAGLRTFMLMSLLGVLTPYVSSILGNQIPIYLGFIAVICMMLASYYVSFRKSGSIGMTTEVAFLLTYIIGLLFFFESAPFFIPISVGIIMTIILFAMKPLHEFAHAVKENEIRDAVIFAALVFIVLPLIPNEPIDPWGALNPYIVWISMVVLMTLSFASYLALKLLGERVGLALTGFFGGLISSTSTAVSMGEVIRENKKVVKSAVFAMMVAASTMFFRLAIVAGIFNYNIALELAPWLVVMGMTGIVLSIAAYRRIGKEHAHMEFSSPISFKMVLKFMVVFVGTMFFSNLAQSYMPSAIYLIAFLSGIFDVDAITISLVSGSMLLPTEVSITAILIAVVVNTISKSLLGRWIGGRNASKDLAIGFIPLILVGVCILLFRLFIAV